MDDWLKNIREVHRRHQREVDSIKDLEKKYHRLAELNVFEQAYNLCSTQIIKQSWMRRGAPYVHGWIYSIADGVLKELGISVRSQMDMPTVFRRL